MEGWLNLRDWSALLEVKKFKDSYGRKGFARDHDFSLLDCGFDECKNRFRGLFNQVLASFLEGRTVEKCMKPPPQPLCSNGRPVDLFKLFWVVRRLGGYDYISREDLWDFVAKEFGLGFGTSVKLIYVKYLHELDQWLWQGRSVSNFSDDGERIVGNLEELLRDMKKEFGDLMDGWRNKGKEDAKLVLSEIGKCGNGTDSRKRLVCCSPTGDMNEMLGCLEESNHIVEKIYLDNDNDLALSAKQVIEKVINEVDGFLQRSCEGCQGRNDVILLDKRVNVKPIVHDPALNTAAVDKEELCAQVSGDILLCSRNAVDIVIDSRKRKRECPSLSEMISWVKNVAKCPDDFARRIPDCSKWKDYGNHELWLYGLLAREALLMKKHVNSNGESSLHQKKFRMHPSMYEEDVCNHQFVEKSRCSQRFPSAKSSFCSCCKSAAQSTVVISPKAETGYSPKKLPATNVEVPSTNIVNYVSLDEPSEKEVSVGPLFQAEVPEWTGDVFESDAKWLGSRMWPPEDVQNDTVVEYGRIGEGRRNTCDCPFPGHTECIRFHIAEKRLKLKRELGRLFYKWRFDHMGEEVSLSWTMDEEKRFKDMIRFNNECTNMSWTNSLRFFPSKTREKLVSYYYNVFLVRRRSYQNRVTPKDADSDDDEKELGSVGDSFGYKAIYAPELRLPVCSENKQCSELE